VAAGLDAADAYSRPIAIGPLAARPPRLRVGVPDGASRRFGGDALAAAAFDAAIAEFQRRDRRFGGVARLTAP
ncbi:hypothetical protein J8J40_22470, partial [Mycobacterium tuberculosis]|nr:hypothetical protein [Mycobacterium tuberculosis]